MVVLATVFIISFFGTLLYGDCVERSATKVCFSVKDSEIGLGEKTQIGLDIINIGESLNNAVVTSRISPNLRNLSDMAQEVGPMAPGDKIRRVFVLESRNERGRFKIEFDINSDQISDKEIFITVK